jgi:cytochrome c
MFGPSLSGLSGRKAGSVPGYAYSPALKASGLTWNATNLDRWLKGPQRLVPGTRMPYPGMPDAKARKAVIGYLLTLHTGAAR